MKNYIIPIIISVIFLVLIGLILNLNNEINKQKIYTQKLEQTLKDNIKEFNNELRTNKNNLEYVGEKIKYLHDYKIYSYHEILKIKYLLLSELQNSRVILNMTSDEKLDLENYH